MGCGYVTGRFGLHALPVKLGHTPDDRLACDQTFAIIPHFLPCMTLSIMIRSAHRYHSGDHARPISFRVGGADRDSHLRRSIFSVEQTSQRAQARAAAALNPASTRGWGRPGGYGMERQFACRATAPATSNAQIEVRRPRNFRTARRSMSCCNRVRCGASESTSVWMLPR